MLIEIKKDVFEIGHFPDINFLMQIIDEKGRYKLFVEKTEVVSLDLYKRLDISNRENIESNYDDLIESAQKPDIIISEVVSNQTFTITEAIHYLRQPVAIILEHSENDAHFLKALIKNFKKKSKKIQLHLSNNWLKRVHGGGSTIDACVKTMLESHQNLPKAAHRYMRCFVLLDSDKEYPTMPLKNTKIIEVLKLYNIPYHILEKREMENYMPDRAFETIKNNENKNYIQAYLQLSPLQKDFFDIQNGFPDKNKSSLPQEIQNLYHTLSDENFVIFRKNKLKYDNFKTEFPKLFESVDQKAFVERTIHQINKNELQEILEKITNLL